MLLYPSYEINLIKSGDAMIGHSQPQRAVEFFNAVVRSLPVVFYRFNSSETQLFSKCSVYGGCSGDHALEQVLRLLEDRWKINFVFND